MIDRFRHSGVNSQLAELELGVFEDILRRHRERLHHLTGGVAA